MLELKGIVKHYYVGEQTVEALKGVNLCFRKNEFVSILGPSGCGKTTLLNIIGGLDRYTTGDMIVNGISTKFFTDSNWDSYRNHSIGFVFQSYNLITHQTVLENVELALTLSGVSKEERRKRAKEALDKVGLADQIKKLPAQLSGGQMQRVAIARALVNNPDIILADEPTGALDTETSVQVMDILKEIAKEKLVIMVTHNPELANEYSTRIINLKDGLIKDDSNPFSCTTSESVEEYEQSVCKCEKLTKKEKKPSMSLLTALSLSLKNLGTKKARTFLTSFAGSIGIIGIALILSLSAGFNAYIHQVQKDTLSNYPITIQNNSMDMNSFFSAFMGSAHGSTAEKYPEKNEVASSPMLETIMGSYLQSQGTNDLSSFKKYLDSHPELIDKNKISAIKYHYNFKFNLYQPISDGQNGKNRDYKQVNNIGPLSNYLPEGDDTIAEVFSAYYSSFKMLMSNNQTWNEMVGNDELIKSQYDCLAGDYPTFEEQKSGEAFPIVLVVDDYNCIPDYTLYMLGALSDADVRYIFTRLTYKTLYGSSYKEKLEEIYPGYEDKVNSFKFEDLLNKQYKIALRGEFYEKTDSKQFSDTIALNTYESMKGTDDAKTSLINYSYLNYADQTIPEDYKQKIWNSLEGDDSIDVEIVGILRKKESAQSGALDKYIYYTPALTNYLIEQTNELDIIKDQLSTKNIDLDPSKKGLETWDVLQGAISTDTALLESHLKSIGIVNANEPSGISIYPTSFENKDYVIGLIDGYNAEQKNEKEQIKYTDYIGEMMSSITVIINAVTYVLIAFVSISLIVSSIMIGVITYISVLERTKEIGILRAIGASKKDIARVFNAETIIIGFISGALGILITVILNIPISLIIDALAGIPGVAALPAVGGVALIIISVILTLVAGIIPSSIASKKDPVIALRSE